MQASRWFLSATVIVVLTTSVSADRPAPTLSEEIAVLQRQQARDLAAVSSKLEAAENEVEALAYQRQLESRKAQTERDVLRVQARQARATNNEALADELDRILRQMAGPNSVDRKAQ